MGTRTQSAHDPRDGNRDLAVFPKHRLALLKDFKNEVGWVYSMY